MTRNANNTRTQPITMRAEPISRFSSDDGIADSSTPTRHSVYPKLQGAQMQPSVTQRHSRFHCVLDHAHLVAQLVHQLLRNLSRRPFQHLGLFRLLRDVQLLNLLQVFAERRLDLLETHFLQWLVLGLLDADERGVAQFVDARLNGEHRRQRHVNELEEAGLEFALY